MIKQTHYPEWIVLFGSAIILIALYGFDLKELAKRLLEWTFVGIGYKLLIDYGIIKRITFKENNFVQQNEKVFEPRQPNRQTKEEEY